jgi:hypothetical protein
LLKGISLSLPEKAQIPGDNGDCRWRKELPWLTRGSLPDSKQFCCVRWRSG